MVVFELNKARRTKVTAEVEAVRSGTCPSVSNFRNWISAKLFHSSPIETAAAFLQWPSLEGFEAFVEKRVEYGEMMEDHVADLQAVIREQLVLVEGLKRAAKLAEERRLQELQRALERMNPAEAEAARRAERERALRRQRRYEAKLAELDAEFAQIKARVREEFPSDSEEE
jgi:DNA anti-recombination protein RmuC